MIRGTDHAAAAAVVRVRAEAGLAAVAPLVGVAVRPARGARAVAYAGSALRRDVVRRARRIAGSAVGCRAPEIDLAAIDQLVRIAVSPAGAARARALAVRARRSDVVAGADVVAAAAGGDARVDVRLAAVGLLVRVAVGPPRSAGSVAQAPRCTTRRCDWRSIPSRRRRSCSCQCRRSLRIRRTACLHCSRSSQRHRRPRTCPSCTTR